MAPHPESWLRVTEAGLFCEPGGFFIDPHRVVPRAVITHGHSDHARPGHQAVLATPETLAIMRLRMGPERAGLSQQSLPYHEALEINGVRVTLLPAGHVLGSAQVMMEWQGARAIVSGDYKRTPDPTCAPFEPWPCDLFVTEATFALPVFTHPKPEHEMARLMRSVAMFPERTHVIGCYSLGKAQRLIALLRRAGWDRPIHLHGALMPMCALYEELGVRLGPLEPATVKDRAALAAGAMVLAPPSAIADRWARRLHDPIPCMASGWMRIRARARQGGVELPLIISDHADWPELLQTARDVQAPEIWITHGREDALGHALGAMGIRARALHLVGLEEEGD